MKNSAFKCPVCASTYFGPIFEKSEHVGRYCKGWPSTEDRSYHDCRGKYEERFNGEKSYPGLTPTQAAQLDDSIARQYAINRVTGYGYFLKDSQMPIERADIHEHDPQAEHDARMGDEPDNLEEMRMDALAALETCAASLFTLASLALTLAAKSGHLPAEDADKLARMMADAAGEDLPDDPAPGVAPAPIPTRRR